MKAIRVHQFGGPDVLTYEDAPDPAPAAGQVLVRVRAAGVNPVDTYIRAGWYGPREFPYIPGFDAAGLVESVGPGVAHVKAGDRVYVAGTISGAYAELALCDAAQVHALPEHLSFAEGAGIGVPVGTAYRALFQRGGARSGETVLVHGATGGVGTAAVQMARAAGLTVFATGGSAEGRNLLAELGAHHVLDHTQADYLRQLMKLTGNRGVDVILEMLANVNLGRDLEVLAKRGRVVVIGSRGKVEIDPRNTMSREADIRGMMLLGATAEDLRQIHAAIGEQLAKGALRIIVGSQIPLADAARAHRATMEGKARGKMVLTVA